MRDRHLPRLCRDCTAPMARQEEICWNCGAVYAPARASETDPPKMAGATAAERFDDDGGHPARLAPALVGV
jgi:predicted amidophosphoribosyltransferase